MHALARLLLAVGALIVIGACLGGAVIIENVSIGWGVAVVVIGAPIGLIAVAAADAAGIE